MTKINIKIHVINMLLKEWRLWVEKEIIKLKKQYADDKTK